MREFSSSFTDKEKKHFMGLALLEAEKAREIGEVPIGAVVVYQGEVIGRGFNIREKSQDATTHAEILAIREACQKIGSWRLENCQLFVTLEPCPMCSGALILSRVEEVYYGASDLKAGVAGTLMNLLQDERFNHQAHVEGGIMSDETGAILSDFFLALRLRNKKRKEASKRDTKSN